MMEPKREAQAAHSHATISNLIQSRMPAPARAGEQLAEFSPIYKVPRSGVYGEGLMRCAASKKDCGARQLRSRFPPEAA